MSQPRIGIVACGRDCPGLDAVLCGVTRASWQFGYECVGFLGGYEGLYDPMRYITLSQNDTTGVLKQGGMPGATNDGCFAAAIGGQDPVDLDAARLTALESNIARLGIEGLVCIGGRGSLAVAQMLHEHGIPVVGLPQTIDNDLFSTAFTVGFDSAVSCATDALDRLHAPAASHERVMVIEVMGRHAGWIALHAGVAGGADVILLPEIPWTFDNICQTILERTSHGKNLTLIVVAEGARLPDGQMGGTECRGGQLQPGGVGLVLARELESRLRCVVRTVVLSDLQRGSASSAFDRLLAAQYGAHAVRLVVEHRCGEMVCYNPPEMTSTPITVALSRRRTVEPDGPTVRAARALGISFGDSEGGLSPFAACIDPVDVATAHDVENDAEFILDLAEAAAEEALE